MTQRIQGDGAAAWEVHGLAYQRRARGEDVIILSIGDPDFDTPPAIVETAVDSLRSGRTHYSEAGGMQSVRTAIARHYSQLTGREIGVDRAVFLPGAQASLYTVCQCLLEPGDEVIVPEPTYVTYEAVIGSTGATPVPVRLLPERGFHLDPEDVRRLITPRTRMLLVNTPHNPTGAVLTREEVEELGAICREHDLWFVTDEVYGGLTYERPHVSPVAIPGLEDRAAAICSLSKTHAMTGWRAGWVVGPPELAEHLERLAICMFYGSPTFIQDAVVVALEEELPELEAMRAAYAHRAEILVETLRDAKGINCHMPEGGMFIMADIRETGLDGWRFARRLLDEEGVSTLPGEGFGQAGAGHVRISLAVEDDRLREAGQRIARLAGKLARERTEALHAVR